MTESTKRVYRQYILLRGTHDGFDKDGARKVFKQGDIVNLTDVQARNFADKFQSAEEFKAAKSLREQQVADAQRQIDAQAKADAKEQADAAKTPIQGKLFNGKK